MIAKFFKRSEFECKCGCGFDTVDHELLECLVDLRDWFGPIIITSGCRCQKHNEAIGGDCFSRHLVAQAADIVSVNYTPLQVAEYLAVKYPNSYCIKLYEKHVHFDIRPQRIREGF